MNRSMYHSKQSRGGGLLLLVAVVTAWSAMRVGTWVPPFEPASLSALPLGEAPLLDQHEAESRLVLQDPSSVDLMLPPNFEPALPVVLQKQVHPVPVPTIVPRPPARERQANPQGQASAALPARSYGENAMTGSNLSGRAAPAEMHRETVPPRWSMDAWALWREDTTTPILSGRPSYGRSQAGAVLRYRLASSSGHAPQLHLRASTALEGPREREVAFGTSVKPIPAVPLRIAAEARVSEVVGGSEVRAAAYAVTEIQPVSLPAGLTAEVYGQAGYVTGQNNTPFVDGQTRVTGRLAGTDDFRLEVGGGVWGGAQEDVHRVDMGPSASVNFRIGRARGRVTADYRFRVAGDAEPSSGPALTLSAGF